MKAGHFFRKGRPQMPSLENLELKAEIEQTQHKMESVRNKFEQVVDPTLIDCYIYELNAAQLRYQFLLRRFKLMEELL